MSPHYESDPASPKLVPPGQGQPLSAGGIRSGGTSVEQVSANDPMAGEASELTAFRDPATAVRSGITSMPPAWRRAPEVPERKAARVGRCEVQSAGPRSQPRYGGCCKSSVRSNYAHER
jgi:hypothetical protein